jgi:glycosyltransferase involved in cell wall biosynthesis
LPNNEESAFFQQRLRAFHPDTVLVNFCWLAPLLENLPGHITKVIETNDVVSQRIPPTPGLPIDPATPAGEAALLSCAQHILAISEDDAASFRARLPNQSIILMPKAAIPRPLGPPTDPVRILFVGGANAFNHEGLQWFLNEVWPGVCQSRPDARLHICGGICVMLSSVPEGVILRGRVADLTHEYAAAAVVIVPLLQGSGVKIKLVEAASYGKAIVTTPVGLQGLGFLSASVIEATQPNDFGAGVLRLLNEQELQEKLSQTILQQVEKHLSHEGAYGPARQVLTGSHP